MDNRISPEKNEKAPKQMVALITGGCSGLGLSAVHKLSEQNYKVIVFDTNKEEGDNLTKNFKGNVVFYKVDVTDETVVKETIEKIERTYMRIDVLVNSAGVVVPSFMLSRNTTSQLLEKILDINVIGSFNVLKYTALVMINQQIFPSKKNLLYKQKGVIINIGSILGIEGTNGNAFYSASKGAIHGMTMPLARDLGKYGIRVVCIAPTLLNTPMADLVNSNPKMKKFSEMQSALGRIGDSKEFADTMIGVIESTYMTGEIVELSGGMKVSIIPKL